MSLLLGIFCLLLRACLFCASAAHYSGDADFFTETQESAASNIRSPYMTDNSTNVLKKLQESKNRPCYCKAIMTQIFHNPNNRKRDLSVAIICLRNMGYNIIHDSHAETFTLFDGAREVRTDCFQETLWQRLNKSRHLAQTGEVATALNLSDEGFFVNCAEVSVIQTLWKVMFQEGGDSNALLSKKKAWNVILQDFRVYGADYYWQHPEVQETFTSLELKNFKKMLSFYQDYVEHTDDQYLMIKEMLSRYIMYASQGVTLQNIQDFLKNNAPENIHAWMGIRMLVRGGYGGHIYYWKGRFFWSLEQDTPAVSAGALIDNVLAAFAENTSCVYITLALYKRGFFTVNAFDVRNILDVLREAGRLPCGSDDGIYGVQDDLITGFCHDERYMKLLQKSDMFLRVAEGWPLDIVSSLKTDIYPKYFGWRASEPVVGKRRRTQGDALKKRCVGEGVMAEKSAVEKDLAEFNAVLHTWVGNMGASAAIPGTQAFSQPMDEGHVMPHKDPMASFSRECSEPRQNCAVEEDNETVKERAQKRQKLLLDYLKKKENVFCSSAELYALYNKKETEETVLEDAVCLIQSHHNIEYNRQTRQYRLRPGQWQVRPSGSSCVQFFCYKSQGPHFAKSNIGEKTYHLYEHGYQSVPLSTIALFCKTRRASGSKCLTTREKRLVALKDKILEDERIGVADEYSGLCPRLGSVRHEDLSCVKESMDLYTDGRAIIAKNKMNDILKPRSSRKNSDKQLAMQEIISHILLNNKKKPCTEAYLKSLVHTAGGHSSRDLYRIIADLRAQKMNIVHSKDGFTLYDGCRKAKTGCYRRVAWHMLDSRYPLSVKVGEIFLEVSSLGYNPSWTVIENIFVLKKLCLHDASMLKKRLVAWDIIVAERALHEASYYQPAVVLNGSDMRILQQCWALYNLIILHQDEDVTQQMKTLLAGCTEGLTLQYLENHLYANSRKGKNEKINVWNAISGMMCGGCAGQIDVVGDRVFWHQEAQNIGQTDRPLFQDFSQIPLDCAFGPATVWLHKRGHLSVSPWDVAQLLDVFAFAGFREPHRRCTLQTLWENIKNGSENIKDLLYKDAVFIKNIEWLQSTDVLQNMQGGCAVNLEEMLKREEWLSTSEHGALSL